MAISNLLSKLRTNLFGSGPQRAGSGTSGFTKTDNISLTKSPISSLDSNPLSYGTYQFPKDVFENQQLGHYMVFYVNVQDRSKFNYNTTPKAARGPNEPDPVGTQSAAARKRWKQNKATGINSGTGETNLFESTRNQNALQGLTAQYKTTTRISNSIALYLPANVSDTTSATYDDTPTGVLGMAAKDLGSLGVGLFAKDYSAMASGGAKMIEKFAAESFKRMGSALAESLTGAEGAIPLANRVFGQADNPFVEVFFNTMDVRTFTYNFNFAPRNKDETAEIQQIIQLFRFHMAPELQGNNSRYYTLPATFDIHYMYKAENGNGYENDYFNRIGTCVLQNVTTNYTPNGVKSFGDGAPTQITMSLQFKETEVLTKAKINEGY
jgi:hypothetical protein